MFEKPYIIESPLRLFTKNKKLLKNSVNPNLIAQFTHDLAILLKSSIPLVQSLEILANQQINPIFQNIIKNITLCVHQGMPFSKSLMKYPTLFDPFFINMIKAGEASSNLIAALDYTAKYKNNEIKLKRKLKTIMIYPTIIIMLSLIITILLFLFIIPKFELIFNKNIGINTIPFTTQLIFKISNHFIKIITLFTLSLFLILLSFKLLNKNTVDNFLLKIPLLGTTIKDINISLFSRILGILLTNGVSMLEALKISQSIIQNSGIQNTISHLSQGILEGNSLSNLLAKENQFSEFIISLIHIGEETGTLSKMLLEIANKLDADIEIKLDSFTSLLEPLLTLCLAFFVGTIVISLFLPLVDIMKNLSAF
ncbi:MAG: hypothetical protein C5B43_03615 [Verrucomicrobia bacterium]|nr:MAG: hypothetical protein C5B43_03615 [Verrucomicrobiota bacterium]